MMTPTKQLSTQNTAQTHQASVFDKILQWLDTLPVSIWIVYLVLLTILIIFFNALAWLEGSIPFGTFDGYRSSIPFYSIGSMTLVTYLNRVAKESLATFRSALDIDEPTYTTYELQLTTMPTWDTRLTVLVSMLVCVIYITNTPYLLMLMPQSPIVAVVECIFYMFSFVLMGVYFYHCYWQLRMVSRIHRLITHIDLFDRAPLYAFSRLSSRTGISLILMSYFGIVTDPATFTNIALIYVTIIALILAVLSFLLPLQGIYRRIVAEKKRLIAATNAQLGTFIREAFSAQNPQPMDEVVERTHLLHSFATTRDVIERIPTLPWEMSTLIGFLSAVAAPAIAGLIVFFASNWI